MKLVSFTSVDFSDIISFLEMAHNDINKKLDLSSKDIDLINFTDYKVSKSGFWCLIENSKIVGCIAVRKMFDDFVEYAEIRRLYVDSSHQGHGLGILLLDFAIDFAIKNDYKIIRATTSFDRERIIKMLKNRGFYNIQKYRESAAELFFEYAIPNDYSMLYKQLESSLAEQEKAFNNSLILNPVENVPNKDILFPYASFLHGLYNTDTIRTNTQKIDTKIQFSGRTQISEDINNIYNSWAELLNAKAVSLRLLSGLHAHTVLFMGIANIGDRVILLPESAGGHMSTKSILERLGLNVAEFVVDYKNKKIDIEKSLNLIKNFQPNFIFVDRSEGLIYEDFSWLDECKAYKIFDASQYLTNIIAKDYANPFDMGFDMILSTLHKNLPGPQRAMIAVKETNDLWWKLKSNISTYVSNMHVFSIYSAGLLLKDIEHLKKLSKNMLCNTMKLEDELQKLDLPVFNREVIANERPTHHLWFMCENKNKAFDLYLTLERIGILTNYRLLPYNLGYGLRIGLSAATQCGLLPLDTIELSKIIEQAFILGYSDNLKQQAFSFIQNVKGRYDDKSDILPY